MRFLADESCDFRVVQALRAAGHDVVAVAETARGTEDAAIIDMAVRDRRVFVTEDRDFGQLVHAAGKTTCGVILLRFPSRSRAALPATVVEFVDRHGAKLANSFAVLQPGRVRLLEAPRD
jgi:predicted nuclease of predicted toxin-antitoxin system